MNAGVSRLFLDLAAAGVVVAADPARAGGVMFRPSPLPAGLAARLRIHRAEVARLLAEGYAPDDPEAEYRFHERLGIAEGLGMPTDPGSVAWLVAVGESIAVVCHSA